MEAKLLRLFDYQKFACNARLAVILANVERRYDNALADDDLDMVNAAGDAALPSAAQEEPEDDK